MTDITVKCHRNIELETLINSHASPNHNQIVYTGIGHGVDANMELARLNLTTTSCALQHNIDKEPTPVITVNKQKASLIEVESEAPKHVIEFEENITNKITKNDAGASITLDTGGTFVIHHDLKGKDAKIFLINATNPAKKIQLTYKDGELSWDNSEGGAIANVVPHKEAPESIEYGWDVAIKSEIGEPLKTAISDELGLSEPKNIGLEVSGIAKTRVGVVDFGTAPSYGSALKGETPINEGKNATITLYEASGKEVSEGAKERLEGVTYLVGIEYKYTAVGTMLLGNLDTATVTVSGIKDKMAVQTITTSAVTTKSIDTTEAQCGEWDGILKGAVTEIPCLDENHNRCQNIEQGTVDLMVGWDDEGNERHFRDVIGVTEDGKSLGATENGVLNEFIKNVSSGKWSV